MTIAVVPTLHRESTRLLELVEALSQAGAEPRVVVTGKRLDDTLDALGVRHLSPRSNPGFGASVESAVDGSWSWLLIANDDIELDAGALATTLTELDASHRGREVIAFLDPEARRPIPTALGVFSSVSLVHAALSRRRAAQPPRGAWYKSFSLVVISRSLWDALDGFDDRLPYTYEDADFALRAWQRGAVFVDPVHHVATHEGSETSKSLAAGVLPVSAYSACRYLEARGLGRVRARGVVLAGLAARTAFVPFSSVDRRQHLRGIGRSIRAVALGRRPSLPAYEDC